MLIVWYTLRNERDAMVIPRGVEHVTRYDLQYATGLAAPHYPLPAQLFLHTIEWCDWSSE